MTNIKVITKIGKTPGKNIVILAGVHGNESFGVKMLEKLIPKLNILKGKVTFIYANLEAIKQDKRFIEYNLNRCFLKNQPKEMKESLEGKTAKEIIPYLEEANLMLDIHASFTPDSVPFIICRPQSFKFAKILPFEIITYNWDFFEPGSTDYYMNLQNKIGLGIECGYLKDTECEERGKQALMNFLAKAGAINYKIIQTPNKKVYKIVDLYKNKIGEFKKAKAFPDFEKLKQKTIIGYDYQKPIYGNPGDILLFVRDMSKLNGECFITAREINKDLKQIKS